MANPCKDCIYLLSVGYIFVDLFFYLYPVQLADLQWIILAINYATSSTSSLV